MVPTITSILLQSNKGSTRYCMPNTKKSNAVISFTVFIFISGRVGIHVDPLKKSLFMATDAFLVSLFILRYF